MYAKRNVGTATIPQSKSNFLLSFAFLEPHRRRGLSAVYAWCRAVDDAVDDSENPEQGQRQLEFWREEVGDPQSGEPIELPFDVGVVADDRDVGG